MAVEATRWSGAWRRSRHHGARLSDAEIPRGQSENSVSEADVLTWILRAPRKEKSASRRGFPTWIFRASDQKIRHQARFSDMDNPRAARGNSVFGRDLVTWKLRAQT